MKKKPSIKVQIIVADYYKDIANSLTESAIKVLKINKIDFNVIYVPGVYEIPQMIKWCINSKGPNLFIALGCVIRGETSHYDYVCGESARGLMWLSTERRLAIGYGILTVENEAQALVRADRKQKNKGRDATVACLEMLKLRKKFVR